MSEDGNNTLSFSEASSGGEVGEQTVIEGVNFGNGGGMDASTRHYVNAKTDAVRAQNDARFAEVLARFDVLKADIDNKPTPPNIWQIAGVVGAGIGALVAIAAFAYDRFDGGVAAGVLVEQAVSQVAEAQATRDSEQDKRLDTILEAINKASERLQSGPPSEQD